MDTKKKKKGRPKKAKTIVKKTTPRLSTPKNAENGNWRKGNRTLTESAVRQIRKLYKNGSGKKIPEIHKLVVAKGFKVTYASVRNVCLGNTWRYLLTA